MWQEEYKLTGLIYHSQARAHYWSELFIDNNNKHGVSPGWYTHDGLANGGKCMKTGNKPSIESQGRHLSLPFYERVKPEAPTQNPQTKPARTWSQTGSSPSGKTPVQKRRQ